MARSNVLGPLAMAVALASCGGGGGRRGGPSDGSVPPSSSPSGAPPAIPLGPATSGPAATAAPSARPLPPPGSVAFTAIGVPLSEPGLRVLVRPSGGRVQVVVRGVPGGSNGVRICPVSDISGAPPVDGCVVAADGRPVDLVVDGAAGGGVGGVLVGPSDGSVGGGFRGAEVTLIYVPDGDSITLVTPRLAPPETPGDCPEGRCAMAFELTPTGSGTYSLEADGRGARPQLTLRVGLPDGGSRMVGMVEGSNRLSIGSTVDGRSDANLSLRNVGPSELPPLEIALVWPSRR